MTITISFSLFDFAQQGFRESPLSQRAQLVLWCSTRVPNADPQFPIVLSKTLR